MIYLDYNATTPIDPAVSDAMIPYLYGNFGNPSSAHRFGLNARQALENSRKQVAEMLKCEPEEIIFTSGGTESNNYAIRGIAESKKFKGKHIITSKIEHPSVLEVCKYLEKNGFNITFLPVDNYGLIDPALLESTITPETILITIMHANNEVGTIQPIETISDIARKYDLIFHTDCAQSIGKIPVSVDKQKVDLLTIAGHKLYAPKGIGALYIKSGIKIDKLIFGASHEMNFRPGTENVFSIVGLGMACELVKNNIQEYMSKMGDLRDHLESALKNRFTEIIFHGHPEKRLPNTLSVGFKDIEANILISHLPEIALSAGAACHSDKIDISHVLEAMNVPKEYAMGTIRFSIGRNTTYEEIDDAINEIDIILYNLRSKRKWSTSIINKNDVKLTKYVSGLGCACKINQQELQKIIKKISILGGDQILVGPDKSDDSAVFKIDDKFSIIQTVDFFTPIVDDPFIFGAIAASNSLSDIYAMGGEPLFALNIVGFPINKLPTEILEKIIEGAQSKTHEAGISILGGHSIIDEEPKFGLVVTGIIQNNKIISNADAKPGDDLILTKPLGTGILSTAMQKDLLDKNSESKLLDTMLQLNKIASETMVEVGVNACTDITGFGLIGHLIEMMNASNTSARLDLKNIKFLQRANEFVMSEIIPGSTKENLSFTLPYSSYGDHISKSKMILLNDAQTSGGLLISCSEIKSKKLLSTLSNRGINECSIIGKVLEKNEIRIVVS